MEEELEIPSTADIVESLTEQQAKFILQISVIAGHLPRYWLEQGVKLARLTVSA